MSSRKRQQIFRSNEFRSMWLERGPVKFAEEYLEVKLSSQQKEFLDYLWKGENPFVSLVAPRNSGKTLCLAIYTLWLLNSQENVSIAVMGGSLKQSSMGLRYIKKWRNSHTQLENIIKTFRDSPLERLCETVFSVRAEFLSCTTKSAKGSHGYVFLDEVSEAERDPNGRESVDAILGQTFEEKTKLIMTSTVDCISGSFYNIVKEPKKHGFQHFTWDILTHVSGEDPRLHYTDKDPSHWKVKPDCLWISQEKIEKLRKLKDDGWFLVNVLGGLTVGSGNVFNQKDLDVSIINFDYKLPFTDLRIGLDCGFSAEFDPSSLVVVGFYDNRVFVLDCDEQNIPKYTDIVDWVLTFCKKWHVYEVYIDPSVSSKPLMTLLESKGIVCPDVADLEPTKELRMGTVFSLVEKHKLIIHQDCQITIRCMRSLYWEKETHKVAKSGDHNFDALCYSLVTCPVNVFEESSTTLEEKQTVDKELAETEEIMKRLSEPIDDSKPSRLRYVKKGEKFKFKDDEETE